MKRVLFAVTWICASSAVGAQDWRLETPPAAPPGRMFHGMSAGLGAGNVVLFGGMDWSGYLPSVFGDTWEWNGSTWIQRFPTTSPPARWFPAQTALGASGITLVFGGVDNWQRLYDTWSWDGITWTLRDAGGSPGTSSPSAYYLPMMCHDAWRNRAVLFGGSSGSNLLAETWEWDDVAGTWTHVFTPQSPPPTAQGYFAFDLSRGVCVLFGGDVSSGGRTSETWEYDGATWRRVVTHNQPPPSSGQNNMAFDPARGRVVAYLGSRGHWEYDGVDWYRAFPANDPGSSWQRSAAYHWPTRRYVMFSGGFSRLESDTWTYGGTTAHFEIRGQGCPGSAGVPELSPLRRSQPALGSSFDVVLRNVAATGVQLVAVGLPSPAPPVDLTAVGMPGCFLYPDPNGLLVLSATWSGAAARLTLSIPAQPSLAGQPFELQGIQLEFAGVSMSGVGRATVR